MKESLFSAKGVVIVVGVIYYLGTAVIKYEPRFTGQRLLWKYFILMVDKMLEAA